MLDNRTHIINEDARKWNFKEVLDYKELILMFTKRNFLLSYSQTILGPLWLFVNPLLSAIIYSLIFGLVANLSSDHLPRILFYFCGSCLWLFFSNCLNSNSRIFLDNHSIYSKVYFPRIIIPLSNVLSSFIKYLCSFIPFFILFLFYLWDGSIHPSAMLFVWVPIILILLACIGLSVGLLASSVSVKYRDLNVVFQLFVQLWMYCTPVIYPLSITSNSLVRTLLLLNPLTSLFELYRSSLLGVGFVSYGFLIYDVLVTILLLIVSIRVFYRVEKDFVDIV